MTLTHARLARINDFAATIKADGDFTRLYVRLHPTSRVFREQAGVREIRTTKHSADAFATDSLGNVSVLWADGRREQLVSDAEIKAAGLYR